ncbi:unnamed protein product [Oppiella nova]|uniref:CN hydrolase domain-containing protein n=1 Tax=Oppiella nova TaxID=334625 RepID=A0A7R9LM58_9ACAR|nr:unnamed protein product [Oppiella nova]CAG2164971.1 unnamed protein product [Oppiella nova]
MIQKARLEHTGDPRQPRLPLIRLRLEFTDESHQFHSAQFGAQYNGRVANPSEVIHYVKRKDNRIYEDEGNIDLNEMRALLDDEVLGERVNITNIIKEYFDKIEDQKLKLGLLSENALTLAVIELVEKDSTEAIADVYEAQKESMKRCLLALEDLQVDDIKNEIRRIKNENPFGSDSQDLDRILAESRTRNRSAVKTEPIDEDNGNQSDIEFMGGSNGMNGSDAEEEESRQTATRGRGRGRGRGSRGRGRATVKRSPESKYRASTQQTLDVMGASTASTSSSTCSSRRNSPRRAAAAKKPKAAVFQHLPLGNLTSEEPSVIIKRNLDVFERIASIASKEGVQILVYPEDAIINTRYPRSKIAQIAEQIPDPLIGNHNPCDNPSEYEDKVKTYRLSCFAKTNNLYIVADYGDRVECDTTSDVNCPTDGHYLFNTAVAFGPDGALLAKYHKMQLFHEFHYNVPPKPELIHFDTPFGRMGLFICFDILFKNPATDLISKYGVKTMLYPLWWFDELPFKSANQVQEGWAFTNQVNLLAANMQFPQSGSIGSGIYSGQNGPMIESNISEEKAHLMIADIPIDSKNTGAKCLANRYNKRIVIDDLVDSSEYKPFVSLDLKGSALYRLKGEQNSAEVCNNGFCCQLDYSVQNGLSLKGNSYWLIVANRSGHGLSQLRYPLCEEFCGVFQCEDDSCQSFPTKSNESIFKNIKISAKFSTNYVYPSATTNDLKQISMHKWIHRDSKQIGSEVTLSLQDIDEPVLSMGLYGRCYDRDPPYRQ